MPHAQVKSVRRIGPRVPIQYYILGRISQQAAHETSILSISRRTPKRRNVFAPRRHTFIPSQGWPSRQSEVDVIPFAATFRASSQSFSDLPAMRWTAPDLLCVSRNTESMEVPDSTYQWRKGHTTRQSRRAARHRRAKKQLKMQMPPVNEHFYQKLFFHKIWP